MKEVPTDLGTIVTVLDAELDRQFEDRLRAQLETKDKAWLIDTLAEHVLRERHLDSAPNRQLARHAEQVEPLNERRRRVERIRTLGLDLEKLKSTLAEYERLDREMLIAEAYLVDPPHKGKAALTAEHRSAKGETLLRDVQDVFYALLFCEAKDGVSLGRTRRDFLTLTLPSAKAPLLERFMLAVTETRASGTWLDPEGVSDDIEAANTILQVEFGDRPDDAVSAGLIQTIRMINNLEINEEILYARVEKLERSTLVG